MKITDAARDYWKAGFRDNVDLGQDVASALAVIQGMQKELRAAFDDRARLMQDIYTARASSMTFEALMSYLNEELELLQSKDATAQEAGRRSEPDAG